MNKAPRKFYFDMEFHEHDVETVGGKKIRVVELIRVAVVDEGGRTFDMTNSEFDREAAEKSMFLRNKVLNKLPPESEWKTEDEISRALLHFVGSGDAEFVYWQAPQDPFLLFRLLAPKMYRDDRPDMLNMRSNIKAAINLAQKFNDLGRPRDILPKEPDESARHLPLSDAKWLMKADKALDEFKTSQDTMKKPVYGARQPG